MKSRTAGFLFGLLALAALLPPGAEGRPEETQGAEGEPLTVAAAASMQPVFLELRRTFRASGGSGSKIIFVFGASGHLARQMEHGAPYDVLVSAEEAWVAGLAEKGILDPRSIKTYAQGRLALVLYKAKVLPGMNPAQAGGPLTAGGLARLGSARLTYFAVANPAHAPYGVAARQALEAAGLWRALGAKLVYGENVRQTLSFVETGNAEAGLVAESIARGSRLSWFTVAGSLHRPIRHALGIRRATRLRQKAERFVALLLAPEGRSILSRFGLLPLPEARTGRRP